MKKIVVLFVVLISLALVTTAQQYTLQKTTTNPETGKTMLFMQSEKPAPVSELFSTGGSNREPEINWQATEAAAVGSKIVVSGSSGYTFNSWWLNDERVALYADASVPVWDYPILAEWEYPIDMTPDGTYMVAGYDSVFQVFSSGSQSLIWEKITTATIIGTKLSEDGTMVYVVENMPDGSDKCNVSAYEVGNDEPVWQTSFPGQGTAFAASGDRSKLAFCQYTGYNKLWVIETENGSVIFDTYYKNQNPPAFSHSGNILLNGDYDGYAFLYEYDETLETYSEKWHFRVGGGGTSAWVVGMDVSADGTTAAIGTLVFITGGYDGEIYTFNTYSPEPLWVFEHAGDQVTSVAVSDDGSLIAAGGYGPLDHSKPDFYLFRKQSSSPVFNINTAGSFNAVDISGDGMMCSVTGKAVHAREFGSGGLLYNINSNPGGGLLEGMANVDGVKIEVEGIDDYYAYSNDDGDFMIKYIPEGTYSVKAAKVGYYPVIEENVVITEGETTTVDFALDATGNPPTDLIASKGAGQFVFLNWNYDQPDEVLGYNIYRKALAELQFPDEPLAFVGNDVLEFFDEDIQPLTDYYYAVTALLETDVQSPYSNTDRGYMAQGFVIDEISVYVGSTPVIDGTIDEGEWDDAFQMDASDFLGTYDNMANPVGSVVMAYKMNEDLTELYVACINENDTVLEDHDEVALYIDDNNDGTYPPTGDDSEGNYWAAYYAAGNELKYRPIYNSGGVGEVFYLENPQLEVSDEMGYIVYEFMIPIGDDENWKISPNEEMQSGMFLFVLDDPSNFDGYWPSQNLRIFEPSGYGTLTLNAEDEEPEPPAETNIWWNIDIPPMIILSWSQPAMNDFSHFNIYMNETGSFELLGDSEGNQLYYYASNTEYKEFYVTTVDMAGNESEPSSIMIYDITLELGDLQNINDVTIYPNPAYQEVSFTIVNESVSEYNLSIYNSSGKLIKELFRGKLTQGSHRFTWDCTNQPAGIYFLQVSRDESSETRKIIIGH
jgi:WD40 repeat protein